MSTKNIEFQYKPIPWMYSTVGSILAMAIMKLSPVHRQLATLEVKNLVDYFNSDFVSQKNRKRLNKMAAFMMTYWAALQRVTQIGKQARQDYYALNRQGCFVVKDIPAFDTPQHPDSPHLPIIIVPGLNTPRAFFREMYEYFLSKGYNVSVLELPNKGLADVAKSAEALKTEMSRMQAICNVKQVNVIGHCLGGLIAKYCAEHLGENRSIRNIISLGTGFLGAEGVQHLKDIWVNRHPGQLVPKVFDELIQWNLNVVRASKDLAYHSILTIWDFMVHFRKGFLEPHHAEQQVSNQLIESPLIDHLTIALHIDVFERIENLIQSHLPESWVQNLQKIQNPSKQPIYTLS